MSNIFEGIEEFVTQEMLDSKAEWEADNAEKHRRLQKAETLIEQAGYSFIQEAIIDLFELGVVHKSNKTWEPVADVTSVASDRIVISKAQAKNQGLEILESK